MAARTGAARRAGFRHEQPRSRRHRQLRHCQPDRSQRPACLARPGPPRRRSGVQRPAGRQRSAWPASWKSAVAGAKESRQRYLPNTAILETIIEGTGGTMRIVDFAPRFRRFGRMFRPPMLVRRLEPIAGRPRVTIRLRPTFDYGALKPQITSGSNHARFFGETSVLRLTTDGSIIDDPARDRILARPADHPAGRRRRERHRQSRHAGAQLPGRDRSPTGRPGCATSTSRSTGRRR